MEEMKASGTTDPGKLAGAIAECVKNTGVVKVRAIGAGAVNQAVKGVIIARGYLAPTGVDICVVPGFYNTQVDDRELSGIVLEVRPL